MRHPISLAFLTTFDVGPVEAVRIAAATGYQSVGLRLLPAAPGTEPAYPLLDDPATLREVLAAMADTGIHVGDVEIIRLKPENDWDQFARFCARAQLLGARHVLVAGDDPDPQRLTASFARFCDLAAPCGLTADLEFMPWTAVPDLNAALAIVEAVDKPNGGVLVDALHYDRSATTLEQIAALPRQRMNYVQFCDGPVPYDPSDEGLIRIARGERLLPGEGGIDLLGLAQILPEGVPVSVEIPHRALAQTMPPQDRAARAYQATRLLLEKAWTPAQA
ncbi:sugar phosphate isomerase/epimerase family protein [Paracoccus shanxieyensis]|uniref:TIM barrel protein n=1 Tax=Paracoccus shanxieyensis TaxID=2675752 RepID=A0A6L6IWV4_9RHOB|nr:sugar phosphate isomerase/epimerase [Paracoccus shanxieyensis]MTH64111.1 TIM barrel protein [Paracoccus shanxieyensis]MTH86848.1 TIM barrel protein [Paracoccus shanxieyensis]